MSCDNANALTEQDILDINENVKAVNAWAEGGPTESATMANGRVVPSPSKLIFDARLYKAPLPWPGAGIVTDATQTYIGTDDLIYAPNPALLPLTVTGVFATDIAVAGAWYVVFWQRPVQVVQDMQGLVTTPVTTTRDMQLNGFYTGQETSVASYEGVSPATPTYNATQHNGGTIIDPLHPDVPGSAGWYSPRVGALATDLVWKLKFSGEVNVHRFGATGYAVVSGDETDALQAAVDTAVKYRLSWYAPAGHYLFTALDFSAMEGATIRGDAATRRTDWISYIDGIFFAGGLPTTYTGHYNTVRGTLLECTSLTGDNVLFGDGATARGLNVKDFGVWGNTTGSLVKVDKCPSNSNFSGLAINNLGKDAASVALHIISSWTSTFENMDLHAYYGTKTGKGLYFDLPQGGGGGANIFSNITASYFDTGCMFGSPYALATQGSGGNQFEAIQGRYCNDGIAILRGMASQDCVNMYTEHNERNGMLVADSAGRTSIRHSNFNDTAAGLEANLQIGRFGSATDGERGVSDVTVEKCLFNHVVTAGIKRAIGSGSGSLVVEDTTFANNGGRCVWIADEEQGDGLFIQNPTWDAFGSAHKVSDGTNNLLHRRTPAYYRWINTSTTVTGAGGTALSPDFDMDAMSKIPSIVDGVTTAADAYILLPSAPSGGSVITFIKPYVANDLELDPNGLNIDGDGANVILTDAHSSITLRYSSAVGWEVLSSTLPTKYTRGTSVDASSINCRDATSGVYYDTVSIENTITKNLSAFFGFLDGKTIRVVFNQTGGTTIVLFNGSAVLFGNGGADWSPAVNSSMLVTRDGSKYYCTIENG